MHVLQNPTGTVIKRKVEISFSSVAEIKPTPSFALSWQISGTRTALAGQEPEKRIQSNEIPKVLRYQWVEPGIRLTMFFLIWLLGKQPGVSQEWFYTHSKNTLGLTILSQEPNCIFSNQKGKIEQNKTPSQRWDLET